MTTLTFPAQIKPPIQQRQTDDLMASKASATFRCKAMHLPRETGGQGGHLADIVQPISPLAGRAGLAPVVNNYYTGHMTWEHTRPECHLHPSWLTAEAARVNTRQSVMRAVIKIEIMLSSKSLFLDQVWAAGGLWDAGWTGQICFRDLYCY